MRHGRPHHACGWEAGSHRCLTNRAASWHNMDCQARRLDRPGCSWPREFRWESLRWWIGGPDHGRTWRHQSCRRARHPLDCRHRQCWNRHQQEFPRALAMAPAMRLRRTVCWTDRRAPALQISDRTQACETSLGNGEDSLSPSVVPGEAGVAVA